MGGLRRTSRRKAAAALTGAAAAVTLVLSVTACDSQGAPPVEATAHDEAREFQGDPQEHAAAMRTCLADRGWRISDGTDEASYGIDMTGRSDTDLVADSEACGAQVGDPPTSDLDEADLRSRYEWRLEQHECLVQGGFPVEPAISFDAFVAEYQRTGMPTWDPLAPLVSDGEAVSQANAQCPYSTTEW